jgi:hypothetical protein
MRGALIGFIALGAALFAGSACDDAEETVEEVEEKAGEAGARASAEAFRASLKAQETDDSAGGVRAIEPLRAAAEDVPGDPDITGIADENGDGVDDDGYVQVNVSDQNACVTLPESGDEIDVAGGPCPAR